MSYLIYMATSPTNLAYIGMTGDSLSARKRCHAHSARRGSQQALHRAIRKYGSQIKWKILEDGIPSRSLAEKREADLIDFYGTYRNGYNMTGGGDGLDPTNVAVIAKIQSSLKTYHANPETHLKHSRERGGKDVYVYTDSGQFVGVWPTQTLCATALGVNKSHLNQCLKQASGRKTLRGYVFRSSPQTMTMEDTTSSKQMPVFVKRGKTVLGTWPSVRACARELHIACSTIRRSLRGDHAAAGDLRFYEVDLKKEKLGHGI